ncbi:hypothetical protein D3C84_775880 [compost metagenome]
MTSDTGQPWVTLRSAESALSPLGFFAWAGASSCGSCRPRRVFASDLLRAIASGLSTRTSAAPAVLICNGTAGAGLNPALCALISNGLRVFAWARRSDRPVSCARRTLAAASHRRARSDLILLSTLALMPSFRPVGPNKRTSRKLISNSVRISATTSAMYCGGSIRSQLVKAAR